MADPTSARRALRTLVVLGLAALGACYNYVPVTSPTPGTTVRVHVPVHSAVVGNHDAPPSVSVEGTLLTAGDTLVVETESTREAGTFREMTLLDTLRVAQGDVAGVDVRQFSKGRTAVFTAALVGAAAGVAAVISGLNSGTQGSSPSGGKPTGAVILSVPLVLARILPFLGG